MIIPGVVGRLTEAYRALRHSEQDVFQSVFDDNGLFEFTALVRK